MLKLKKKLFKVEKEIEKEKITRQEIIKYNQELSREQDLYLKAYQENLQTYKLLKNLKNNNYFIAEKLKNYDQ